MLHHVDGESELYLDDALLPILVATWIGAATLELNDKLHAWADEHTARAKREGRPMIIIADVSAADRPSAPVRRSFAEHEYDKEVDGATFVVVTNPLVRGAMTAIGWMMGDALKVTACSTLAEALDRAVAYAHSHNLATPPASEISRYATRSRARSA